MTANMQHVIEAAKLPQSFDGNGFLYASSLAGLMSITCLGAAVCGWMIRDTWHDRFCIHPKQLLFGFRMMIAGASFAAFARCLPEVLYLQAYGDNDLSADTVSLILIAKRIADTLALPIVATWMLILVAIYPPICVALKSGPAKEVIVDKAGAWPRLVRPFCLFVVIAMVSCLTAYNKVYGG